VIKPRPQTRYITVDDADVAYQVVGEGPRDLLVFNPLGSNIEGSWLMPGDSEPLDRVASFSRLIIFDRRGVGASDSVPRNAMPTWEDLAEDAGAVLDAVGSQQTSIFASLESGPMALLFAAMHPERVGSLILLNAFARALVAHDYPIGFTPEDINAFVELVKNEWGTPDYLRLTQPSQAKDPDLLDRAARMARASTTPRMAADQYDYILRQIDARDALPFIQAPTLVLSTRENSFLPPAHGRYLAEHINGARFVELPGSDLSPGDNTDRIVDEVAEFLTGERPVEIERLLTTVLFTDIVDSTGRASALGDRRWRALLDAHDRAVRDQLRRSRGKEINTTGDGFVASFDGPARAIRCAQEIVAATRALGIELRVGLHTGECEVRGDDLGGLAVHIAARVAALGCPGEVLVSRTVVDLTAGSGLQFEPRGEHQLKGVPGTWPTFAAVLSS
jgi:class 3 adenylate cyclase